jgi:hypothetical protein
MLIAKTIRCIAAAKLAALGELRRAPSLQRRLNCAISSTAAPSRHKPPRRLQVFGAVRERRRAARSRSFLRRPIASLPSAVASKKQRLCQPLTSW